MTANETFEELKDEAHTATERVSVAGNDLIAAIQALLREAAVRKITVQDKNGRTLVEFPLYAGVIGAFFVGSWTVLALIAAWFAEVSILIERDIASDGEATPVGEAIGRAASGVSDSARTAAASAKSGLGATLGGAFHAAGDLARQAADSLESRMAAGQKAAEAIIEAAEESAAEPKQCAGITKSGTRCKRNAVPGSDFCAMHAPKE